MDDALLDVQYMYCIYITNYRYQIRRLLTEKLSFALTHKKSMCPVLVIYSDPKTGINVQTSPVSF